MTNLERVAAITARRLFKIVLGYKDKFEATYDNCDFFGQEASNLIKRGLESDKPFAVSRFGYSELRTLLTFLHVHENKSRIHKLMSFAQGQKVEPWWNENTIKLITHNAGVFPQNLDVIENFCRLSLKDITEIDVLGSWLGGEVYIKPLMPQAKFMRFYDFYHFLHEDSWTAGLRDKKVLVVHPFARSIEHQYSVKDKIFSGAHTLPDFELLTYKAVQSIAGNKPIGFNNWFDALNAMKSDLAKLEFDIAILGCGAYGMPLAAFIKRDLEKKAIHLGGNTQILFGIKGSRWENDPKFSHIFNQHWIKPLPEETPEGYRTVDSSCYW